MKVSDELLFHMPRDVYVDDITSGAPTLRFEMQGYGTGEKVVKLTGDAAAVLGVALLVAAGYSLATGWGWAGEIRWPWRKRRRPPLDPDCRWSFDRRVRGCSTA